MAHLMGAAKTMQSRQSRATVICPGCGATALATDITDGYDGKCSQCRTASERRARFHRLMAGTRRAA